MKPPLFVRVNEELISTKNLNKLFTKKYNFLSSIDTDLKNCIKFTEYPEINLYGLNEF